MSYIRVNVKKIENIRKQDEMYKADYYFTYPKGNTVYVCKTLQLPSLRQFLKIAITRKVWLKDEIFDKSRSRSKSKDKKMLKRIQRRKENREVEND